MTWSARLRLALSPPADVSKLATGLTFTDILFGFVISQLFIRLQNWADLVPFVRCQLIASTILVLGSWIGFRRSLNRSLYELKFFNLPLARFVLDQAMVILYFRVAVVSPSDSGASVNPASVTGATLDTFLAIFILYAIWDALGIWMAVAKDRSRAPGSRQRPPKYPKVDRETEKPKEPVEANEPDWAGLSITVAAVIAFLALLILSSSQDISESSAKTFLLVAGALLLVYRLAKEVKNSWRASR